MSTPPWKRTRPDPAAAGTKLTPENLAWAKERARRAGRPYPNLIDNMAAKRRQLGQAGGQGDPGLRGRF
jgi:hypothetical protein